MTGARWWPAAVLAAALASCSAYWPATTLLWSDDTRVRSIATNEVWRQRDRPLQLGSDDGAPALAVALGAEAIPDFARFVLEAEFARDPTLGWLVARGSPRAALVRALLDGEAAGAWRAKWAALLLRAGSATRRQEPGRGEVVVSGRLQRQDLLVVLTRAEAALAFPALADLLDTEGEDQRYGDAARAFLDKPWLEWAGSPFVPPRPTEELPTGELPTEGLPTGPLVLVAPPAHNGLLALVGPGGEPVPLAERPRVARWFARGSAPNAAELAELATLTAVGRLLTDDGATVAYVAVPALALLMTDVASLQPAGEALEWHFVSDWQVRASAALPAQFDTAAAGLTCADVVLQRRDALRILEHRSDRLHERLANRFLQVLLTPLTAAFDVTQTAARVLFFGWGDEARPEREPRRR